MNSLFICRKAKLALWIFAIVPALLFFSTKVYSQDKSPAETTLEPFLLLEKPGTKKRIRFYKGDEIEFKLKNQKTFHTGTIVQFSDTSFYVNDYVEVPLRTVEALADRSKVPGVRKMAINTLFVIPVIFVFSGANNLFNTGDKPIIDKEVYPLSAAFAGLSGLGFLYKGKRYRLKNKWRIIMVRL